MINQKSKVFLFTFLILSLALLPPTNFAFAADELIVQPNQKYIVTLDEEWNTVRVMPTGSLIIPADTTLTVNQIDLTKKEAGLDVLPNGVVTIEKDGNLVVNGVTQNKGEIFIDGSYLHTNDNPSGLGLIFNDSLAIYERCGLLYPLPSELQTYSMGSGVIQNDIENCLAPITFNITNLTVEFGQPLTILSNETLNLFGETTLRGNLIIHGILNNPTIVTLAGGDLVNEGTINNICGGQGYDFPDYVGSGGDQIVGDVVDVPCLKPEAVNDDYQVNEDTTLTVPALIGVLENDIDNNGHGINATNASTPSDGTLSDFALDGSFTYTPNENFFGTDSFTYQVKDGYGVTDTATVTIDVLPVSDGPIALNDAYQVNEDETLTVPAPLGVLRNDTDVDMTGDFTAQTLTDPSNGILALQSNGAFTYTPTADFSGTDSFTYDAIDGNDATATATVTITVDNVLEGPTANPDTYLMNQGETLSIPSLGVLENDVDVDGTGTLTAQTLTDPSNGILALQSNGAFTYTPTADFSGTDSFTYDAIDGTPLSDTATVTITVTEFSLQEQKINEIEELDNLSDEASEKKTEEEIKKAVKDLDKSVEDKKWEDNGNYLVYDEGNKVFDEQQKGVKHMMHILDQDKESDDFLLEITSIALDLVDIDNQIATNEFIIAQDSPNATQQCLDDAEYEYVKSDRELEKGKYDKAIDHLGHLWKKSLKCQGINTDDGPGRK